MRISNPISLHTQLGGVTATQHHTATVAGDIALGDLATRAHADLSDAPGDAHHTEAHTPSAHTVSALEFARIRLYGH